MWHSFQDTAQHQQRSIQIFARRCVTRKGSLYARYSQSSQPQPQTEWLQRDVSIYLYSDYARNQRRFLHICQRMRFVAGTQSEYTGYLAARAPLGPNEPSVEPSFLVESVHCHCLSCHPRRLCCDLTSGVDVALCVKRFARGDDTGNREMMQR